VRLVEVGQSIAATACTLSVVDQTLFNWVKAKLEGKLINAVIKSGLPWQASYSHAEGTQK
jgi:transposase